MNEREELPLNPPGSVPRQPTSPFHIEAYDRNEIDLLVAAMRIGITHARVGIENDGYVSVLGVGVSQEGVREFSGYRALSVDLYEILGLEELASGENPFSDPLYDDAGDD